MSDVVEGLKGSESVGHYTMLSLFNAKPLLARATIVFPFICTAQFGAKKTMSSSLAEDPEMKDLLAYLDSLKNFEKSGVPTGAGTDSNQGFDSFWTVSAVHIAGTNGKGSTAAFISNILRKEGYSVGCYTSPHIQTIRERILLGRSGNPVSAITLNSLFHRIKSYLDQAVCEENGRLSHFEVFTAMAFILLAEAQVDIAVIEAGLGGARDATNVISPSGLAASVITTVGEEHLAALGGSLETIAVAKSGIIKQGRPLVLGGPFLPHIEHILRRKAASVDSPVVSASDAGNRWSIKSVGMFDGRPYQSCDIAIEVKKDLELSCELINVKLHMLGSHQLQNAATATCVALCLRRLGWRISDESIRAGLEHTSLLGRSQFLTNEEARVLGITGATVLIDGAHTKESAKALMNTIKLAYPEAPLGFIVAMASDKDHVGFAKEILSGEHVETVILTEAAIAGGVTRMTSAVSLKDSWIQASQELGVEIVHDGSAGYRELVNDETAPYPKDSCDHTTVLATVTEGCLKNCLRTTDRILRVKGVESGIIVVTGSLHVVSSVLACL